jgi:hypothetical protein
MYNEQLEKLIEMALIDGELTEKEKQILFKKAEAFGVDLDEFEMVLEAKLFEKKQNFKKADSSVVAASKSDKFGDIKKCPACGTMVGAFKAICSDCGHEFSNVESVGSVQKLYAELMRVEEEERNRKADKSVFKSLTSFITDHSPLDDIRLKQNIWSRKSSVVSAFPVPNTKADILEFLSLAVSEGGKKISFFGMYLEEKAYIKTWRAKAEQVVMKARFSLKEDKNILEEIDLYAKQLEIK